MTSRMAATGSSAGGGVSSTGCGSASSARALAAAPLRPVSDGKREGLLRRLVEIEAQCQDRGTMFAQNSGARAAELEFLDHRLDRCDGRSPAAAASAGNERDGAGAARVSRASSSKCQVAPSSAERQRTTQTRTPFAGSKRPPAAGEVEGRGLLVVPIENCSGMGQTGIDPAAVNRMRPEQAPRRPARIGIRGDARGIDERRDANTQGEKVHLDITDGDPGVPGPRQGTFGVARWLGLVMRRSYCGSGTVCPGLHCASTGWPGASTSPLDAWMKARSGSSPRTAMRMR